MSGSGKHLSILRRRGLIWLTAAVGGLLLLEGVVRLSGAAARHVYDPIYRPSGSPGVVYEHRPGARGLARSSTRVRINGAGLRADREYARRKPAGTTRVVLLGDSVTFGQGVSLGQSYPTVLERELLPPLVHGQRVEVLNFGVSGYNIDNMVATFGQRALPFEPDVAVLALVSDDLSLTRALTADDSGYTHNALTPSPPGPIKRFLRRFHLSYWLRDRWWALTGGGRTGLDAVEDPEAGRHAETWARAREALQRFAADAHAAGATPIVAYLHFRERASARRLAALAADSGLRFVGSWTAVGEDASGLIIPGDGHPSAAGHRVHARALAPVIAEQLSSRRSRAIGARIENDARR